MLRVRLGLAIAALTLAAAVRADAQAQEGRRVFTTRCAVCHGADGFGGDTGPSIVHRLPLLDDAALATLIREGRPAKGMPPQPMPVASRTVLTQFLRRIQRREEPLRRAT